jgi:TonB family protein
MLASTLVLTAAAAFAQAAGAQTDCATAMARGLSTATTQVCQAEAELVRAQSQTKDSQEWRRSVEGAATLYKRALGLPADELTRSLVIERLLVIFDIPMLNNQAEMLAAFGELRVLKPTDVDPLFRLASYQEAQNSLDAAEETLLSARRLQPDDIKTFQMLAQYYARRARAMHATAVKQEVREQTVPGAPDKNGVYQVGGDVTPPRRFGNPTYPTEATAAGIEGVVTAEITVNEQGIVTGARVLNSNPLLDEAALRAVREWRYDPTMVNGKAVPVKMTVTVNFSLNRR